MPYKRILLTAGLVFLGVYPLAGCREQAEETEYIRPVKTIVLDDSARREIRVFPGTVRAAKRAMLSFRVSGPLVELPVLEGQQVRKGQLLAKIDPRDYQRAVSNLEARLADLNAQYKAMQSARPEDIRRMEASLSAAQSRLLEAAASFRRYQRLYENNNISKAEYDQARAARDVAESDAQSAQESLTIAKSGARPEDLEAMEARIQAMEADLRKAQDQLKDTELRAPYDGLVAERYVDNYEYMTAFTNVLSLQNINVIEIVALVPERVLSLVKQIKTSTFTAGFSSAPGVRLPAKPTEIAAEADPVTRTYDVIFQTDQPENFVVFAGMTAEVEVSGLKGASEGFLVPVTAVFGGDTGDKYVWVLDEGSDTARKTAVKLGEPSGEGIWVVSGLKSGDRIVTAGTHFLNESQKVRPITDELRDRK